MTLPLFDPALPDVDLREAFMQFPAPLAMLDSAGRITLANLRFLARFPAEGIDAAALEALSRVTDGAWHDFQIGAGDASQPVLRVRSIRTAQRVLVIVDETQEGSHPGDAEALRARIADLEKRAATDHLTGAWNRAHLDSVLETELARSMAGRQPLSLILFDIDHFKNVNDTYGHAVGDSVLRELVQLARTKVRASDLLFRWGGEEFVVLATSVGYRGAERIAESLRQAVAGHSFDSVGAVTISLGVAEHDGDEDPASWFRRMDAALYEAKRTGRNRCVVVRCGNSDKWVADAGGSALHLVWQEAYECGDPTIDAEHRELFILANKLIDASVREEEASAGVMATLDELIAHVQRHFADEEAILERLHYDHLIEHRRAHAGLLRRAGALRERVLSGAAHLGEVVEFLAQDVVARHLIAVDRAFFHLFA
jgi:diguanylate cyclase (GGDEF)-like protein/hemerythrin-like metal-binding protein